MRSVAAILALIVGVMLLGGASPAAATAPAVANQLSPSPRDVIDLSRGWRFRLGVEGEPVGDAVADADWARVTLPHSWNRVGSYTTKRDPRTDLTQGVGWYRLRFPSPDNGSAQQFLQFDGVGTIADVWLNGRKLGQHRGAFGRFRFDVTGILKPGGINLLVVRADNSERRAGSATGDVIPLSGDFFMFGGIYRGVSLVTTAGSHIDLLDHGGPGVYATTASVEAKKARIVVRSKIVAARPVSLVVALDDADGRTVARRTVPVARGDARTVTTRLDIPDPHLWNGRADPYLYTLRAELRDGRALLDRVSVSYGIRTVAIDPDRGFMLNGHRLALHGVSRHQDRLAKGWAIDAADHAQDMALAEELGANTIRMAHYQHAPEWFDLADRAGMVAWAEIPFVNQVAWSDKDADPALVANARTQLIELIRQNYNHPSVVTWSVGNEVDIHARGEKWGNHSRSLLADLAALAKREDPSRPTTFADCCEESVGKPLDPKREMLAGTTDLVGYNRYYGWYYGTPDQLGPALDLLHRRHPRVPIAVSEYGAGGAISQHSDDPRGGPVAFSGRPQPEEYQAYVLERSWPQIAARPYLWASWVWNLADFATRTRAEGDATDLNTKGLVTADRKVRKDAFYYLQANWSDRPILHLTGKRYVDRRYPVIDVKAYTNAATARLRVNGQDLGEMRCAGHICLWPGVRLAAGANVATVSATIGERTLTDAARWTAPDPSAGLAIDAGALVGGDVDGIRYGSDTFFTGGDAAVVDDPPKAGGATTRSVRRGDFVYRLPLPPGRWRVRATMLGAGRVMQGGRTLAAGEMPGGTQVFTIEAGNAPVTLGFHCPDGLAALVVQPED